MGGTQFNGRALVHGLVRAGHDVTVCNRGRTPAELPAGVCRLSGCRLRSESPRPAGRGQSAQPGSDVLVASQVGYTALRLRWRRLW